MSDIRSRRSSEEVRKLILDAARKLFRSNGFDATSTREISAEAGVSESMLFRNFGSKKAIFDEAVLKPFIEFVQQFVADWARSAESGADPEHIAHRYVSGLFQLCRDHLELIALIGARREGSPQGPNARLLIAEQLDALVGQLSRHHTQAGSRPAMDPRLSVRFAIAMTVGAAQLGDEFFGIGDQLTSEIAAFVVRGAGSQPPKA
ncbi:TetR/AcrR family transcriptional regulator [Mycobacterium colombiense]